MSSVLEKARSSGKYPPSLLGEYNGNDDGFETALLKILDANGTLRPCKKGSGSPSVKENETIILFVVVCYHQVSLSNKQCFVFLTLLAELYLASGTTVPDDFKEVMKVR